MIRFTKFTYFPTVLFCFILIACGGSQQAEENEEVNNEDQMETTENEEPAESSEGSKWDSPDNFAPLSASYDMMNELSSPVPKKADVPVSPYPGAVIFSYDAGLEIKGKVMASMKLASPASVEQVKEHYESELGNWSYEEVYEIHTFKQDPEAGPMQSPLVEISAWDDDYASTYNEYLDFEPMTLIMVAYEVKM